MSLHHIPSLHGHIPPFIAVSSGPLMDDVPQLSQDEWASLASVAPMSLLRLAEFAQGRHHARKALAQMGVQGVGIPVSAARSPVWPQGFTGSISHVPANPHKDQPGWVIAATARSAQCAGLGIDLERTDMLMPEHWHHYMTDRELTWIRVQPMGQRNDLAHGIWSVKEAVMKALTVPLAPQDMEVRLRTDTGSFDAKCRLPGNHGQAHTVQVGGWVVFGNGWVLSLAGLFESIAYAPQMGHQPGTG